jgi:hypothetical protein
VKFVVTKKVEKTNFFLPPLLLLLCPRSGMEKNGILDLEKTSWIRICNRNYIFTDPVLILNSVMLRLSRNTSNPVLLLSVKCLGSSVKRSGQKTVLNHIG